MSRKLTGKPHGQLRRSQLITSFGPGSMVDLPNHAVLIGGLDTWFGGGDEIVEPRLTEKLKQLFDPPLESLQLRTPPPDNDEATGVRSGITAWQFPEWFIAQDVDGEKTSGFDRSRMLVHRKRLTNGKYIDDQRKKRTVVPVRFVRACPNGHLGDIDWYYFCHGEKTDCRRRLWIAERGTSGDLSEVYVRCDCGARRSLKDAVGRAGGALGRCDGNRPWIGPYSKEGCDQPSRLLIRQASNAYFAQLMSVISLPDRNAGTREAVESVWDFVGHVTSVDELEYERRKPRVRKALEGIENEAVLDEVKVRLGKSAENVKSAKQAEMETLISQQDEIGEDRPDGTFLARNLPRREWDAPWMRDVERIVLVHRLREVMAQVGFTRLEAVSPDIDGELEMEVRRAPLAEEISWLPAIENRGEGIFIQFRNEAVEAWEQRKAVHARGQRLLGGYESWKSERPGAKKKFVEAGGMLPYVLFHSFSHLLITSLSLECGYPASSIRERIYCVPDVGYGVMIFTGSSDAEGTLGGLIQAGRRIHHHIRSALRIGELCSNDPVCAQHEPASPLEKRFLQGAACHGCLLISETSCELHNDFLDRALVVPTIDNLGAEFFSWGSG